MVKLLLVLLFCAVPLLASADEGDAKGVPQAAGLMWNRTGLPAVFPLQVKTPAGQDYFLTLINDETGEDALAAYLEGGEFFRVLVPPGIFRLNFAAGDVWQGEEALFGSGKNTRTFELEKPLTFKIRGLGAKAGHLVNLLEVGAGEVVEAAVKDQMICQTVRSEFPTPSYPTAEEKWAREYGGPGWIKAGDGRLKYLDEDLLGRDFNPNHPEYYLPTSQFLTWSQYCG